MKKYTFLIVSTLMFGAFNAAAQSAEKNGKKVEVEKTEVKLKNEATLKPAQSKKSVSSEKRTVQKARVKKANVQPIKKEEDL